MATAAAAAPSLVLIPTLLLLLLSAAPLASAGKVNEYLEKYGLPKGLMPDEVKSHSINDAGEFSLELPTCYVHYRSGNLVSYSETVSGKLSYGQISDLQGVITKRFFFWVPITAIVAHEDNTIQFWSGILSETYSADYYKDIPKCESHEVTGGLRGAASVLGAAGLMPAAEV